MEPRRRNSKRRCRKIINEKHNQKNQKQNHQMEETPAAVSICQSPAAKRSDNPVSCFLDFESGTEEKIVVVVDSSSSCCTTPKADKFKIPEIRTCPPAPKKQRPFSSNCSLRRTPLVFFAPPDLDNFLFSALHGIST